MYNDFILVGPEADPAHVYGGKDIVAAFRKIAETKAPFIARGDDSGTSKAEMRLWKLPRRGFPMCCRSAFSQSCPLGQLRSADGSPRSGTGSGAAWVYLLQSVHLAAWIGLVPRQHSSGGKQRQGGISKQGDRYLRRLLVLGADRGDPAFTKQIHSRGWLAQKPARTPACTARLGGTG